MKKKKPPPQKRRYLAEEEILYCECLNRTFNAHFASTIGSTINSLWGQSSSFDPLKGYEKSLHKERDRK
jgi:hypothetical protein